jgi:methanethiol S-methyltransferase
MAAEWFKKACRSAMGRWFIYYRLLYSLFAFITLGAVLVWQFSITSVVLGSFSILKWLPGLPAGLLGLFLMGVSIRKYFFNLSGISVFWKKRKGGIHTMNGQVRAKGEEPGSGEEPLELGGLHRYIRHPLYLGTLLVVWSLFLFFPSLGNLLACFMITAYTLVGIRFEERKLLQEFGEDYAAYRRKVPMLIPRFPRPS